jgi:hypothetical protein
MRVNSHFSGLSRLWNNKVKSHPFPATGESEYCPIIDEVCNLTQKNSFSFNVLDHLRANYNVGK